MPGWMIPGLSALASAMQAYMTSRGGGYQMSEEEKRLLSLFAKESKDQSVPGAITAPFYRHAEDIKQSFARRPGASGKEHGIIQRQAYTPLAEASGQYLESKDARLQASMANLVRGTGTRRRPMDIGKPLEGIGGMLFEIFGKKESGALSEFGDLSIEDIRKLLALLEG